MLLSLQHRQRQGYTYIMAYKKYPTKKRRYPFKRQLRRKLRRIAFMVVAVAIISGVNYYKNNSDSNKNQVGNNLDINLEQ